jgi:hypothetical protein
VRALQCSPRHPQLMPILIVLYSPTHLCRILPINSTIFDVVSAASAPASDSTTVSLVLNTTVSLGPGAGRAMVLLPGVTSPFTTKLDTSQSISPVVFWLSHAVRVSKGHREIDRDARVKDDARIESHNVHLPSRPRDFLMSWNSSGVVKCVVADQGKMYVSTKYAVFLLVK